MSFNLPLEYSKLLSINDWTSLNEKINFITDNKTLAVLTSIALHQNNYEFLESAVTISYGFPFQSTVNFGGYDEPILHQAIRRKDIFACQLILAAGAPALACSQKCRKDVKKHCQDTLQLLFSHSSSYSQKADHKVSDIACLILAAWTKQLQQMIKACQSGNLAVLTKLLDDFKTSTCNFRAYTESPAIEVDGFTVLSLNEVASSSIGANSELDILPTTSTHRPAVRALFSFFAEEAERALSGFLSAAGEQMSWPFDDKSHSSHSQNARCPVATSTVSDIYAIGAQTNNSAIKITQQYLNSLLIIAIENSASEMATYLLDFGFRLCLTPRPSVALCAPLDTCLYPDPETAVGKQGNPLTLLIDAVNRNWLSAALEPHSDTPLLASIRCHRDALFHQIISKIPQLCMLPGTGGNLPIHLAAALGRSDLLQTILSLSSSNNNNLCGLPFSIDMIDDYGLTAFLIACVFGNLECVRLLLNAHDATPLGTPIIESPQISSQTRVLSCSSSLSMDSKETTEGRISCQQFLPPINVFRTIALQWQFLPGGSNIALLNPQTHMVNKHICGHFGALHIAVITGNFELVCFLMDYVAEDLNKPSIPCSHNTTLQFNPHPANQVSTAGGCVNWALCFFDFDEAAKSPSIIVSLSTPLGLACCLDDIVIEEEKANRLSAGMVRFLVSIGAKEPSHVLLHHLLHRQRFTLAGCLLSTGLLSTHCTNRDHPVFGLDWSNRNLALHIASGDPDLFECLLIDWFLEAGWQFQLRGMGEDAVEMCRLGQGPSLGSLGLESLTKLNLSNNSLAYMPICILTKLPNLQELDLSRNKITVLPDISKLDDLSSNCNNEGEVKFMEQLLQLDLSRNSLLTIPSWLFGVPQAWCSSVEAEEQDIQQKGSWIFAPYLTSLRVAGNRVRTVPRHMWLAPCLVSLDISENAITALPCLSLDEVALATRSRALGKESVYVSRSGQETSSKKPNAKAMPCRRLPEQTSTQTSSTRIGRSSEYLPRLHNALTSVSLMDSAIEGTAISTVTVARLETTTEGHRWTGGLVHLWIQRNHLRELPEGCDGSASSSNAAFVEVGLSQLAPNLTSLDASFNQLTAFGSPADYPPGLIYLDLANNRITTVGNSPPSETNSNKNFSSRQGSGGMLRNLLHLNLRGNKLVHFDPSDVICGSVSSEMTVAENVKPWFPDLTSLDLSGNLELRRLPSSFCHLLKLSVIELDSCRNLEELPSDLWRLSRLKSLTFFGTPAYEHLSKLIEVSTTPSNKKITPSQHGLIVEPADRFLNTTSVLAYLKALPRCSKPYNKIRLMVLGAPGVGKSAFVRILKLTENPKKSSDHLRTKHSGSYENLSSVEKFTDFSSSGVHITPLVIKRRCPDTNSLNEVRWTEVVQFSVWDFDSSRLRHARQTETGEGEEAVGNEFISDVREDMEAESAALSAVQQFYLSRSAIFVVVWKATEGPTGLEAIAKCLVDIQCRAPLAPVFIVGTHGDQCSDEESNSLQPGLVFSSSKSWSINELTDLVRRRYFRFNDPAAVGLPSGLQAHFILDCATPAGASGVRQAAALIHRAANLMRPHSCTTSGVMPTSRMDADHRLLNYPVPTLYHDLEKMTHSLADELRLKGLPPIISLDDFITEMSVRLQKANLRGFDSPSDQRAAICFLNEVGVVMHFSGATLNHAIVIDPPWLCGMLMCLLALGSSSGTSSAPSAKENGMPVVEPKRRWKKFSSVWSMGNKVQVKPITQEEMPMKPSTRAGILKLKNLEDIFASELLYLKPTASGDESSLTNSTVSDGSPNQCSNVDRSFALTYLVGLLAKFELAVPLDSQHLLIPTLLPPKCDSTTSIPRQVRITPRGWKQEIQQQNLEINSHFVQRQCSLDDSDPLECSIYTLPRRPRQTKITGGFRASGNRRFDCQDEDTDITSISSHRRPLTQHLMAKLTQWQLSLVPSTNHHRQKKQSTHMASSNCGEEEMYENDSESSAGGRPVTPYPLLSPLSIDLWKLAPPPQSMPTSSFVRDSPVRKATRVQRGHTVLPVWELKGDYADEIFRVYAMTYIPSGFWTRLITRLLTDSNLNALCSQLYNLSSSKRQGHQLPPDLVASLLTMEPSSATSSVSSPSLDLFPGWSLSRTGLQLTLVGGTVPVLTLEQVGKSVSSLPATALVVDNFPAASELGSEAVEVSLNSGQSSLTERDFKSWHLSLLRLASGTVAESYRDSPKHSRLQSSSTLRHPAFSGFVQEPFVDFSSYCLIQLHMPVYSIVWPDYVYPDDSADSSFGGFWLKPDAQTIARLLTKVVHHIDCLLEDWYPDLGTRFHQSNSGNFLIHRIIPCNACVRHLPPSSILPLSESDPMETANDYQSAIDSLNVVLGQFSSNSISSSVSRSSTFSDSASQFSDLTLSKGPKIANGPDVTNLIHGVLVEEYVHWFLTCIKTSTFNEQSPSTVASNSLVQQRSQFRCPLHMMHSISAPDLVFDDVGDNFVISSNNVTLEHFLGRGAFGSVFSGSVQLEKLPVAVKLFSPIDPHQTNINLSEWTSNDQREQTPSARHETPTNEDGCTLRSPEATNGDEEEVKARAVSDLGVAEALYRQEQRRWAFQPVESCFTAYQELRSELAVLLRVMSDGAGLMPPVNPHAVSATGSVRKKYPNRHLPSFRGSNMSFRRRHNQRGGENRMHPSHLLTCLGIVCPRPLCLLLPLAPQGSLSDWITTTREQYDENPYYYPVHPITLNCITHQVALALSYLHGLRIVYRDLKPDNLLVWQMPSSCIDYLGPSSVKTLTQPHSEGDTLFRITQASYTDFHPAAVRIVLSDFGVSRTRANLDGCRGYVGTPGYMAPEILENFGEETYTAKVDVYSFGILMANVIKLQAPYHGFTSLRFQLTQHILSGGRPIIPPEIKRHVPMTYLDLMTLCWSSDPSHRPSSNQIVTLTRPVVNVFDRQKKESPDDVPAGIDSGFSTIRSVSRLNCFQSVTCATVDSRGCLWLGGLCLERSIINGDGGYDTSSFSVGRLIIVPPDDVSASFETFSQKMSPRSLNSMSELNATAVVNLNVGLACSWTPGCGGSVEKEDERTNETLPVSLVGGPAPHPLTLCATSTSLVWCTDSVGRLLVFCTNSLTLLASVTVHTVGFMPSVSMASSELHQIACNVEGECIFAFPITPAVDDLDAGLVLGLSTGWLGSACLSLRGTPRLHLEWVTNTLKEILQLYLCGAQVSANSIWLGGTGSTLASYRFSFVESPECHRLILENISLWHQYVTTAVSQRVQSGAHASFMRLGNLPSAFAASSITSMTVEHEGIWEEEQLSPVCSNMTVKIQRLWTYSYPAHEVTCWAAHSSEPLRSVEFKNISIQSLPDLISNLNCPETAHNCEILPQRFIERLIWIPQSGLYAGLSCGALFKISWPEEAGDPIVSRLLTIHRGPADPCYVMIGQSGSRTNGAAASLLTVGKGFVHPLNFYLSHDAENSLRSQFQLDSTSAFFIAKLFDDDWFDF